MTHAAAEARSDIRERVSERTIALYEDALVWDMTLPWLASYADKDVTLPRFRSAGVDFACLTVNDFPGSLGGSVRRIAEVTRHIGERSDTLVLVKSVDDIHQSKREGKLALAFNLQETNPLEGEVNFVQTYYDLGVRYMLLAYNQKNLVGDGCSERTDAGLSRFGVRVVQEMNRVGVIVDGSHSGYRTTMEAMEVATAPFIFSHSLANAVHEHYRNIRDDQIKACAKSGGVIGFNGVAFFLGDETASSETVVRHIDHISNLVGPEHVGIGLDYCRDSKSVGVWTLSNTDMWPPNKGVPFGETAFVQPEQLLEITDMLLARGYEESDVRGILGENFARVARQVWK
jgi:membrane dipeptidase